ncbi:MAG: hypothetical protein KFH87_14355 [Bacteroidetes bacterium]|nr:hypothetical protein [Bacteroidota bacterium]
MHAQYTSPATPDSTSIADGTSSPDSTDNLSTPASLSFGFERNINTFLWDMGGNWDVARNDWSFSVNERFQRTLIRTDRGTVKDEQNVNVAMNYDVDEQLALVTTFSSFIFSDNRALALNDLSSNELLGGVHWRPLPTLSFIPQAGVSFDTQQGITDRGFAYALDAGLMDFSIGNTLAQAEWHSSAEFIDPRFQQEHRGTADFLARFADSGINHTQLLFRSMRREFYLPYDSTLEADRDIAFPTESRDERIVSLRNTLQYRIADPLRLLANVELSQRDIARKRPHRNYGEAIPFFDADITEFRLNGNIQFMFDNNDGTTGLLRIEQSERDEVHEIIGFEGANPTIFARQQSLERQKNNTIRQTQLGLLFSQALSTRDTLSFSASTVKMQYDAPSPENFDDRDELFILAGLRWSHRFSPHFRAALMADVNLRHTVFILAERSANNTWNRVFRVSPATELRIGTSFVSRNSAEVVANYTVYDFETQVQSQRSFSLRQLTLTDSTLLRLGGSVWAELHFHLRLYERGELRWSAFTMRPLQFFDERTLSLSLLRLGARIRASIGIRYYEQRRYGYSGREREPAGILYSYGPTADLRLRLSTSTHVMAEGWYQLTSENSGHLRSTPNIALRVFWYP